MGNIENETFQESEPGVFPGDGQSVATTEWRWGGDGTGQSTVAGDPGGGGIIQWTPWQTNTIGPYCEEKTGKADAWKTDLGIQLDCLHEMNMPNIGTGNSYSLPGAGLSQNLVNSREEYMKMSDPEDAARQFQAGIERPNNAYAHTDRRINSAKWFYENMEKLKSNGKSNSKKKKDSDDDKDDSKSGKGSLEPMMFGKPTGRGAMFGRGDETTESMVWWYLKQMGLTDEGAAGVMGNMQAESGINPTNLQDSYETSLGYTDESYTEAVDKGKYKNFVNDQAGYGIVQFTYHTLKKDLYDRAKDEKKSIGSLSVQLETLEQQLTNNHGDMLAKLKKNKSIKEASDAFLHNYENPEDQSAAVEKARASYGEEIFNKYKGTEGTKIDDAKVGSSSSSSNDDSSSSSSDSGSGDTIGSFLSNVLADSTAGQIINSFINFSSSGSSGDGGSSGGNSGSKGSGTAADLVRIAADEIGKESGMTNKYNDWLFGPGSAQHWCAAFVAWCADQAGIPTDIIPKTGGTIVMDEGIRKKGKRVTMKEAKPGDIVFFSHGGNGGIYHVGIVEKGNGDSIDTIEGNTGYHDGSTGVTERHTGVTETNYDNSEVLIDRPAYGEIEKASSKSKKKQDSKDKEKDDNSDDADSSATSGSGTLYGLGENEDKPLAKFGVFKESMYGTGSDNNNTSYRPIHTNLQGVRRTIRTKNGNYTVYESGIDRETSRIMKSASRKHVYTKTFGLGTSDDTSTTIINSNRDLINVIIKILYTIADNTDKLNMVVAILNNKLGTNITPQDISNASSKNMLKARLHQSLNDARRGIATSKINTYADQVGDVPINTIIQAMNAIAAE